MVYTLTKGRRFLLDKPFKLYTDHKPLLGLLKKAARGEHIENQRMSRTLLDIAEFQSEAFHVQGERNILSDFGTRPPAVEEAVEKPETCEMISVAPYVKGNEPWLAPVLCLSNDPEFTKGITVSYNGIMKQSGTCRNVL